MKQKAGFFLCLILFALTVFPSLSPVTAAKKRIRKPRAPKIAGVSYSSAKLLRDQHSIQINFLNLGNASAANYSLNYLANGTQQGAGGTIQATGQTTDSRILYFGTCSHGVCTPHYPSRATLVVTTTLKTGEEYAKRYTIKL